MLNVALFVLTSLGIVRLGSVCSMPVRVIQHFEIWRVFTPAWFHAGVLHIAMNMSTFVGMGPGLERQWGSLLLLLLLMVFATVGTVTGLLLSVALSTSGMSPGAMWECGIGFSGVLFSLLVVIVEAQGSSQLLFGIVTVSARAYPWLLLAALQIMLPAISFVGHLSGVLLGYAAVRAGLLQQASLLTATADFLRRLEATRPFSLLRESSGYVPIGGDVLFGIELPLHGGAIGQVSAPGGSESGVYSNDFPDLGVHVPPPSHACDDFPAATVVDMPLQAGTLDSTPGSAGLSVNAELGWSCASCSFINDPCALRCAMCTQPRA